MERNITNNNISNLTKENNYKCNQNILYTSLPIALCFFPCDQYCEFGLYYPTYISINLFCMHYS